MVFRCFQVSYGERHQKTNQGQGFNRSLIGLGSISNVERFYMEEDMKGREREKIPLSFNIMSHTPHTSIIELN